MLKRNGGEIHLKKPLFGGLETLFPNSTSDVRPGAAPIGGVRVHDLRNRSVFQDANLAEQRRAEPKSAVVRAAELLDRALFGGTQVDLPLAARAILTCERGCPLLLSGKTDAPGAILLQRAKEAAKSVVDLQEHAAGLVVLGLNEFCVQGQARKGAELFRKVYALVVKNDAAVCLDEDVVCQVLFLSASCLAAAGDFAQASADLKKAREELQKRTEKNVSDKQKWSPESRAMERDLLYVLGKCYKAMNRDREVRAVWRELFDLNDNADAAPELRLTRFGDERVRHCIALYELVGMEWGGGGAGSFSEEDVERGNGYFQRATALAADLGHNPDNMQKLTLNMEREAVTKAKEKAHEFLVTRSGVLLKVGDVVHIDGLQGETGRKFNSKAAKIVRLGATPGRWVVSLQDCDKELSLKHEKLSLPNCDKEWSSARGSARDGCFFAGDEVFLQNLAKRPELNGRRGIVQKGLGAGRERYELVLLPEEFEDCQEPSTTPTGGTPHDTSAASDESEFLRCLKLRKQVDGIILKILPKNLIRSPFRSDTTCPMCLDFAEDPLQLESCSHVYCRECVSRLWKVSHDCLVCQTPFDLDAFDAAANAWAASTSASSSAAPMSSSSDGPSGNKSPSTNEKSPLKDLSYTSLAIVAADRRSKRAGKRLEDLFDGEDSDDSDLEDLSFLREDQLLQGIFRDGCLKKLRKKIYRRAADGDKTCEPLLSELADYLDSQTKTADEYHNQLDAAKARSAAVVNMTQDEYDKRREKYDEELLKEKAGECYVGMTPAEIVTYHRCYVDTDGDEDPVLKKSCNMKLNKADRYGDGDQSALGIVPGTAGPELEAYWSEQYTIEGGFFHNFVECASSSYSSNKTTEVSHLLVPESPMCVGCVKQLSELLRSSWDSSVDHVVAGVSVVYDRSTQCW